MNVGDSISRNCHASISRGATPSPNAATRHRERACRKLKQTELDPTQTPNSREHKSLFPQTSEVFCRQNERPAGRTRRRWAFRVIREREREGGLRQSIWLSQSANFSLLSFLPWQRERWQRRFSQVYAERR